MMERVFISGCQRTGTTMLRLVLESHSFIQCFDEAVGYDLLVREARGERVGFEEKEAAGILGFKIPRFAEQLTWPAFIDPDYGSFSSFYRGEKVIHMVRDPLDVIGSMMALQSGGGLSWLDRYGRPVLQAIIQHPLIGLSYKHQYRDIDLRGLPAHLVGALYWEIKTQGYFDLIERGYPVLLVSYERLVSEPRPGLERVCAFLGAPWSDALLDHPQHRHSEIDEHGAAIGGTDPRRSIDVRSIGKYRNVLGPEETWDVLTLVEPLAMRVAASLPLSADWKTAFVDRERAAREQEAVIAVRDKALADRDRVVAERDIAVAERDTAVFERARIATVASVMQRSRSWRVTRPLRVAARWRRRELTHEDRGRLSEPLHRAYGRLPLPAFARDGLRVAYRQLLAKPVHAAEGTVLPRALPNLRPQLSGMPDYYVWGVIDWHFRHQRPQQLATALAATGRRVFYVSAVLSDEAAPGFSVEALDDSRLLFQLKLHARGAPSIYRGAPEADIVHQLRDGVGQVLTWADSRELVSMIDHPYWCDVATCLPNSRVVYDCMDHHDGFGNNHDSLGQLEQRLLGLSDLTVVTSEWLDEAMAPHAKRRTLIRNGCAHAHFASPPDHVYRDPRGRRVIGYYGAIAEWFDVELIAAIARQHPEHSIMLIGADTVNAGARLAKLHNVTLTGEVPYGRLPFYLHGFDICVLPFKVVPLTLATNPVKVYEYLSAGKPVVAVDLPELRQFDGLVYRTNDHASFLATVQKVLAQPDPHALVQARQAFARAQTWEQRADELIRHVESSVRDPVVSIVVVTYNNLDLTRACLRSLDTNNDYENTEVIVVDNASADDTPRFLSEWAKEAGNRKVILNQDNRGFAAANNQGLATATGDYLVLLNNDTYVTSGWIRTLVRHLERDHTIGLIGPVTNNIGNEAKVDISYESMDEMPRKASVYTRGHVGQIYPMSTAAFFCVMMSRATFQRVGILDEAFGRGYFEDDDYCRRVEQAGLRVVCAEDVFIHHHLSASFSKLREPERQALFDKNKKTYEAKWGTWVPHGYRIPADERLPSVFVGQHHLTGLCVVCGQRGYFFYKERTLWRESLTCQHCRSTSRYRSVGQGILRAIKELTGVEAASLAQLPHAPDKRLWIYDTQPPFHYENCAYPIPELLRDKGWIEVALSQYKPGLELGRALSNGISNQNLEALTYPDESQDIVITSDVMEHVRLDDRAHREIFRVLRPGGIYLFTVPHSRSSEQTLVRVQVRDPDDPSKDEYLLEPEYHGDANSDGRGVLAYRVYGLDLDRALERLGFEVEYRREDTAELGVLSTELYYCRKAIEPKSL